MSEIYYMILFLVFGLLFGSFFNVVGYRLPNKESIVKPPSHCPKCKKRLKVIELIPVFSYIFLLGKCSKCKKPISLKYLIFELLTGLLFMTSYLIFGISIELILALVFVSGLIIIIISDINYLIIPDEVTIITSILIIILLFFMSDIMFVLVRVGEAAIIFGIMFLIKLFGDFIFKKESLGGGDIKLMFLITLVIGFHLSLFTIIGAAFVALPISLGILVIKKTNIISFGPFLSLVAILLYFLQITPTQIYDFILK